MSPQPSLASPDHLYSVAPEGRALSFAILRLVVELPVRVWNPVTLDKAKEAKPAMLTRPLRRASPGAAETKP